MIPDVVQSHLLQCHRGFEHRLHPDVPDAQRLAQAEHVSGYVVAKPVIVRVGGERAMAVVAAPHHVDLGVLQAATGQPVELVPESQFEGWFPSCEAGAEPPLAVFGMPIYADAALALTDQIVMPAGTHQDAVIVHTAPWLDCEDVRTIVGLGIRAS